MDAFYASVELLRYPELRGQPVVIGGRQDHAPVDLPDGSRRYARLRDYVGRGVITTSTYEARALGVFSAMGMMKAARLAPDAILLPVDFPAYRHYSRRFKEAVAGIAPHIEDRGIDEIYIDLSAFSAPDSDTDPIAIARQLKAVVHASTGLSCSIGLAPNKLLAKICSDLDKPDGLTVLLPEEIAERIWPMPVRKINGIGPKAEARLAGLGIHRIAELAAADPVFLQQQFGRSYGNWLHHAAHGRDQRPLSTERDPKSVSRETTFGRDLHPRQDRAELSRQLIHLCERVADDLQRKQCRGRTIGIKLRFADFHTVTRDHTLPGAVCDAASLLHAARECLRRVDFSHGQRLRLLGIRAGSLSQHDETAADTSFPQGTQGELHFE